MADKDEKTPNQTQAEIAANEKRMSELQAAIEERQRVQEREEVERQARGFPSPLVASRSVDGPANPVADRLAMMEAQGAPPYLIKAEKESMEANRAVWADQLVLARSRGAPQAPAPVIGPPGTDMEMLTAAQQEQDAILNARVELHMDNPPRRNGMTLEESILSQPDETIPGGIYIINGQVVDSSGRVLVEK